jgi:small subunit ribosomal protein S3
MGQKTSPIGFRLGYNKLWLSRWYAERDYATLLHEDIAIRRLVKAKLMHAGVAKIEVERSGNQLKMTIHTKSPGIIIGRKGVEVDKLKAELEARTKRQIYINIREIKKPELEAQLVAESIAMQLEKRVAYRRAMKKAVAATMRLGGYGIKVRCSGRLAGAEIARTEWYREGQVPLHTLRANIDYGFTEATTPQGNIGVKVWINRGELLPAALYEDELPGIGDRR